MRAYTCTRGLGTRTDSELISSGLGEKTHRVFLCLLLGVRTSGHWFHKALRWPCAVDGGYKPSINKQTLIESNLESNALPIEPPQSSWQLCLNRESTLWCISCMSTLSFSKHSSVIASKRRRTSAWSFPFFGRKTQVTVSVEGTNDTHTKHWHCKNK